MLHLLHVIATFANAQDERTPEQLEGYWRSVRLLETQPALFRRVEEPLTVAGTGMSVTLTGGWLVPIFSGTFAGDWERDAARLLDRIRQQEEGAVLPSEGQQGTVELVGFAWAGGVAVAQVDFPERGDAHAFANRLVLDEGWTVAEASPFAHGQGSIQADRALVLGANDTVRNLFLHDDKAPSNPMEIVVYADETSAEAVRRATSWAKARLELYNTANAGIPDWIARTRTDEMAGISPDPRALVLDLRTERNIGGVPPATPDGDRDLFLMTDERGTFDVGWRSWVGSLNLVDERTFLRRFSGERFPGIDPTDPLSAAAASLRVEMVHTDATLRAQPVAAYIVVEAAARVRVRAVGGSVQGFTLSVPRVDAEPNSWEVRSVTDSDGAILIGDAPLMRRQGGADKELHPDPPKPGPSRDRDPRQAELDELHDKNNEIQVFLRAPIADGEEATVLVDWTDTWSAHMGTTGIQSMAPWVTGSPPGDPTSFRFKVLVPKASGWNVAASGRTLDRGEEGDWRYLVAGTTDTPAAWPMVAVGLWVNRAELGTETMPAVNVHLLTPYPGELESFPGEVRRVVSFYEGLLPRLPVSEIEVFESARRYSGYKWVAGHGLIALERSLVAQLTGPGSGGMDGGLRGVHRHLEHELFAHEIAHQWFGHLIRPASYEDFWIAETFSNAFACLYIANAFQDESDCRVLTNDWRHTWTGREFGNLEAGLVRARESPYYTDIVYRYGPLVMMDMLRSRIGGEAWHAALDVLLRERAFQGVSTLALQRAFESTSGQDLSDFFDFWVRVGRIPAVDVQWKQDGADVVGEVQSDVPFGTFDLGLLVVDRDGVDHNVPVTVVDGVGPFRVAAVTARRVRVDPDSRALVQD